MLLSKYFAKNKSKLKPLVTSLLALVLLILSAYVSVTLPISEKGIPFTAQSLVVFILAGVLKPKQFLVVISVYLFIGILGLPVFADGTSGWSKVVGSSGGFLYGFLFSGLAISIITNKLKNRQLMQLLGGMIIGTILLFIFGLGHLSYKFGWDKALEYGLYPFWKMALVKAMLAGILVYTINSILSAKIKA